MKRLWHLLAAAMLAAGLGGCGPGVGGTGTGASGEFLGAFGASAQPLCGAPFAADLACNGASVPGAPVPAAGSSAVAFADAAGDVRVEFDGNAVALDAPCVALQFDGVWGLAAGSDARFYGGVERAGATSREPAQLEVAAVAGPGAELRLVLRDAEGRALLGPLEVRPAAQTLPAPVCS